MFGNKRVSLASAALAVAVYAAPAFGDVIMDFDATNWSGNFTADPADNWVDSVAGVVAQRGGLNGAAPTKSVATINGQPVDAINFTSDSFDVNTTTHPLAGKKEFTISLVFRTTTPGAGGENNFYQNNGFVGKELPGPGVGDWNLGVSTGGLINGGTGLGSGDTGTPGPVVNDGAWHVASFVIDNNDNGTFTQTMYVDGVAAGAPDTVAYNTAADQGDIAASNFAIGARRDGDNGYITEGSIARLQFDDLALTPAQIASRHTSFLGEAVPEPASAVLLLVAGTALLARRRRA